MSVQSAECRFCGQMIQIETKDELTAQQAQEEAVMLCQCLEAREYQREKNRRERALENVRILFGEGALPEKRASEGVVNILLAAVDEIYSGEIAKITIQTHEGVKASISQSSNGGISVERTETKKHKLTG